jgi:hypothetical protein
MGRLKHTGPAGQKGEKKMENDNRRIVEINGVKVEVDLRTAKTVDSYKVGDEVKLLIKGYGETWTSYPGIIVGFDEFPSRPTLIIAYLKTGYGEGEIMFSYLNKDSKDVEICPVNSLDLVLDKNRTLDCIDTKIEKAKNDIADLEKKRRYFLSNFSNYFREAE